MTYYIKEKICSILKEVMFEQKIFLIIGVDLILILHHITEAFHQLH